MTIEIEAEELEDAKRKAARKISRQVRIKGFRKGKAPYRIGRASMWAKAPILEEALEALGDALYKQALEESEVVPYGPGAFEDFQLEPLATLRIFRALAAGSRFEGHIWMCASTFEAPEVTDGKTRSIRR